MRRISLPCFESTRLLASLLCLALCMVTLSPSTSAWAQSTEASPAARVIVKYREAPRVPGTVQTASADDSSRRMQHLALNTGMLLRSGRHLTPRSHVVMTQGMTSQQLAEQLSRQPDVEYAVVDGRVQEASAPNDPHYLTVPVSSSSGGPASGQWYLRAPDSTVTSSINVEQAWDITTGSASVVVAVIDSGVRFDHPDLLRVGSGGNLLDGYDFVTDNIQGNDGSPGRDSDASDPGNWVTSSDIISSSVCQNLRVSNSSWHGTQTAGLIGALTNNGVGIAGVGRNVRILPVRALGKCGGFDSDVIAGARWAAGLSVPGVPANTTPARVLNMSLSASGVCSQSFSDAFTEINNTGAVIVVSAGNTTGHAVGPPANCPGAIAVAGLRHVGTKVGFSDIGPEVVVSAPGGNCVNDSFGPCLYPLMTTTNTGTTTPVAGATGAAYTDSFNPSVGTSFSAPLVSGAVALMLSVSPQLTPTDVRTTLQRSARPFPTSGGESGGGTIGQCQKPNPIGQTQVAQFECYCTTDTCGAGMLDVGAAVQLAANSFLPRITLTPALPLATQALTLSATDSVLPSGSTIATYLWTVVDGGGIVDRIAAGSDTSTASIVPSASGRFTVQLTLTTDQGLTATTTRSIEVNPATEPPPGSGGGALQPLALMALAAAVWALRRHRRQASARSGAR